MQRILAVESIQIWALKKGNVSNHLRSFMKIIIIIIIIGRTIPDNQLDFIM
jgi:hypothetical protein